LRPGHLGVRLGYVTSARDVGPAASSGVVHGGLSDLDTVLTGDGDGIALVGPDRRFAYVSPAVCWLLGRPLEELRGQDFLESLPVPDQSVPEHHAAGRLPGQVGQSGTPFTCLLRGADGAEREITCSTFAAELAGNPHWVAIFHDLSGPPAARARTVLSLAQATAQPVTRTIEETLADIARNTVANTRALAAGIAVVGDDHKLAAVGGYGFPAAAASLARWSATSITLADLPGGDELFRNRPVVLPDARIRWETHPVLAAFAATLTDMDWRSVVYVPLCRESRVLGVLFVYFHSGLDGPSEVELAVYTALAGQAAMAVTIARLAASLELPARRWSPPRPAASIERARLARELHDSVSQALFSMTMYARTAQLAMTRAGMDEDGPLSHAVTQLADLAEGAMAEMRALIFELRPVALAEEGLVAALRTQAAALTAREGLAITVVGPGGNLELGAGTEENVYRIVLEALHNVVKHARASRADVRVTTQDRVMRVAVSDDGAGFDTDAEYIGHLGLSTMAGRARVIGAELTVTSTPGSGTTVALVLPRDLPDWVP
jgi:PAS domain S-box-containing protein